MHFALTLRNLTEVRAQRIQINGVTSDLRRLCKMLRQPSFLQSLRQVCCYGLDAIASSYEGVGYYI